MNAVAGNRALESAAIAHFDGDAGSRTNGFPMQNEMFSQVSSEVFVGIERCAEQAAVGATELLVQFPQQAQRDNWFGRLFRRLHRLIEVRVPEEARGVAIALAAHGIQRMTQTLPFIA